MYKIKVEVHEIKMYFQQEISKKLCRAMSKAPKIICKNALTKPPPLSQLEYYFVAIIFLQIHYFVQDNNINNKSNKVMLIKPRWKLWLRK